jgi:SAM-dependent methyltransferase
MNLWDIKAKFYNSARSLPILKQIYEVENRNLQQLVPAQTFASHLDLGTGTGTSLHVFPSSKRTVVSDYSLRMLMETRKLWHFPAILLDANFPLPFQPYTFDLITAAGLLEYLENPDLFFKETHRIANKDAIFIFTSSPPGRMAKLRLLTGARPLSRSEHDIRDALSRTGWKIRGHERSAMQEQWCCHKE